MEFKDRFVDLLGDERGAGQRLSKAIGASSGVINGWKTGEKKPSLDYIVMLAEYFGVTTDYLLCVAKESEKPPALDISENGREMLALYNKLSERDQILLIGRLQQMIAPLFDSEQMSGQGEKALGGSSAGASSGARAV